MGINPIVPMPSYLPGKVERIEATRDVEVMEWTVEMLRGFGFDVKVDFHLGFFLVIWTFPKLHAVK